MFPSSRDSLCALGALAALVALVLVTHQEPTPEGPELPRRKELEARLEAVQQRARLREEAARQLIAGRTTVLQTAARFYGLDTPLASVRWEDFRAHYPRDTDGGRFCWEVIGHIEG